MRALHDLLNKMMKKKFLNKLLGRQETDQHKVESLRRWQENHHIVIMDLTDKTFSRSKAR